MKKFSLVLYSVSTLCIKSYDIIVEVMFSTLTLVWKSQLRYLAKSCILSIAQGGVQGLELSDDLVGRYGVDCWAVVIEQHSDIGVPLVQAGYII